MGHLQCLAAHPPVPAAFAAKLHVSETSAEEGSTANYGQPMLQHNGPTAQSSTGTAGQPCAALPVKNCAVGPLC